jgi:hypothetical protein
MNWQNLADSSIVFLCALDTESSWLWVGLSAFPGWIGKVKSAQTSLLREEPLPSCLLWIFLLESFWGVSYTRTVQALPSGGTLLPPFCCGSLACPVWFNMRDFAEGNSCLERNPALWLDRMFGPWHWSILSQWVGKAMDKTDPNQVWMPPRYQTSLDIHEWYEIFFITDASFSLSKQSWKGPSPSYT